MAEIRKWNEKKIDEVEEMTVVKPVRIKEAGAPKAKGYKPGAKVKVSGLDKKDMYFRLVVCYPEDYAAVKKMVTLPRVESEDPAADQKAKKGT